MKKLKPEIGNTQTCEKDTRSMGVQSGSWRVQGVGTCGCFGITKQSHFDSPEEHARALHEPTAEVEHGAFETMGKVPAPNFAQLLN